MGKERAVAAMTTTTTTPVFPFPAAANETDHFSDYGLEPQLLCFSQQLGKKRAAARRHQQPPLEHARFKPQKHQHTQKRTDRQRRRRWWSSAASAALQFFKRTSSNSNPAARTASSSSCGTAPPGPLYFADDGRDDSTGTGCTCWSPAVRSGHLTAAELGIASVLVPYVSLRDVSLSGGIGGAGGVAPSMPIYLVT